LPDERLPRGIDRGSRAGNLREPLLDDGQRAKQILLPIVGGGNSSMRDAVSRADTLGAARDDARIKTAHSPVDS
jgi:hypothetical protein